MINETELNISNKSYINKDFVSIYNELVDLAIKLSYKYNPESTDESDPFIVLLKLMGFTGDKVCYVADKGILERFMPSATQWNSMQELTEMMGYNMHYYIAPTTTLNVMYDESAILSDEDTELVTSWENNNIKVNLPKFTTKFSTNSGDVNFVALTNTEFMHSNLSSIIDVIQGDLKHFSTLNTQDQSKVTLRDLDDRNRLYFPEVRVAQNGVFITGDKDWDRVDTLNNQPINSSIYMFGYDSDKRLPFIQFPNDISNLIGDGLTVDYVVTQGYYGNVEASTINKLLTSAKSNKQDLSNDYLTSDNFSVNNSNSATDGEDIEDINSAYNNFKKTVGTFDTLVTCRDYANYIYRMVENENDPLVSNVQVCDRRDDYNYSTKVTTFDEYGEETTTVANQNITPFDLCLYPLQPMTRLHKDSYISSFEPLSDIGKIINRLEGAQSISHNYKSIQQDDIYAIKNMVKLNANISTTYKVNELEQYAIKTNIIKELMTNFNARKVDYGYKIPTDTILSVIENADARIKNVSLDEPKLVSKVMFPNGTDTEDLLDENYYPTYVAKNVLAGRTALWNYYKALDYEWGETGLTSYNNITSVTSATDITIPTTDNGYTLQENECIQIMSPNYIEKVSYPYGWWYLFKNGVPSIPANTVYTLSGSTVIELYDDADMDTPSVVLKDGDIIKANFDIIRGTVDTSTSNTNGYRNLKSNETITKVEMNQESLEKTCYLYWITNTLDPNDDTKSIIPFDNNSYVLQRGEYLYRTDSLKKVLYTYGQGTLITFVGTTNPLEGKGAPIIDNEEIIKNGMKGINDLFSAYSFTSVSKLVLTEQQIISLVEGDSVKTTHSGGIALFSGTGDITTNDLTSVSGSTGLSYKLSESDTFDTLPSITNDRYLLARLDIDASPEKGQELVSGQKIYWGALNSETVIKNTTFKLKYAKSIMGGTNINIAYYNVDTIIPNEIIKYTQDDTKTPYYYNSTYSVEIDDNGYTKFVVKEASTDIELSLPNLQGKDSVVMIYVVKESGTIKISPCYNLTEIGGIQASPTLPSNPTELLDGMNVLVFPYDVDNGNTFTIDPTSFTGSIIVSEVKVIDGLHNSVDSLNPMLGITNSSYTAFKSTINNYYETFYYNCNLDKSRVLENDLNVSDSLYEYNNIANKITISEIDIDYAIDNINIYKSSQL